MIEAVPDFSVFSEERMTVCEGGRLVAMSVEGTNRYGNRVRVFTGKGESIHGLTPPSEKDRCFVRGDKVLALPSGFSFDLEGKTLRRSDAGSWDPWELYDVDAEGNRALFGKRNVYESCWLWERDLKTGTNRDLVKWPIHTNPFYMADGSILTEGPSDSGQPDKPSGNSFR